MTTPMTAEPGTHGRCGRPRPVCPTHHRAPVVAESGDPFAAVRVIDLVARLERGRPVRLDDLVDRLNATWTRLAVHARGRRRRR